MKVVMAQINSTVGDIHGNIHKIKDNISRAISIGADIIIFPEGSVTGYPAQDLLLNANFIEDNEKLLQEVIENSGDIIVVVGFVHSDSTGKLYNSAAICQHNKTLKIVNKALLPTYDVFDENRYFKQSNIEDISPTEVFVGSESIKIGVEICEDLWDDNYELKVTETLIKKGAQIIITISASPFHVGKMLEREQVILQKIKQFKVPFFYINLVGGQDELIFDGRSFAIDKSGNYLAFGEPFNEDFVVFELNTETFTGPKIETPFFRKEKEVLEALTLGLRDYFLKTGFKKAIIGLSGGIDSSFVACIAVQSLGKENCIGVYMPSQFSSNHSEEDSRALAENLGIFYLSIPIQDIIDSYSTTLADSLDKLRFYYSIDIKDDDPIADENIQPRIRGNILMDFSNRLKDLGLLVLNTANKTELALGYCTLYGDMSGGLSVIGDVNKTDVYNLSFYINTLYGSEIIPLRVFEKVPSAELKPEQFDPFDYDVISPLVDEIIENKKSKSELLELGYSEEEVNDTLKRIRLAEYKRRQAPPCLKITRKAFGIGRKMPIINKYIEENY